MKKILLLLADGFETFEASVFIDVIGWNLVLGDGSTELFTCGLQKEVKSSFNQRLIVASICVGALPLGKSGVLKGKKGTTYNLSIRRNALKSFGVNLIDQPIITDDNLITSWNPSTAIDVALLLLELMTTKKNADQVRYLMGF